MTSGYSVPWARNSAWPDRFERLLEDLDESAADDLAFGFWIGDATEFLQEKGSGLFDPQIDLEVPLI